MLVQLSKRDLWRCEKAASLRWQLSRAAGVVNQRKDQSRTDEDVDFLGIKGEVAVANLFRVDDYHPMELGIDLGNDMSVGDISVDVKTTFHMHGKLAFKTKESFVANTSVLVTATEDPTVMNIVGHCPRGEFLQMCQHTQLGDGWAYAVRQDQLRPIENLWLAATSMQLAPSRRREPTPPKSSIEPTAPDAPEDCWP